MSWFIAIIGTVALSALVCSTITGRRGNRGTLPTRRPQELQNIITHVAYEFIGLERALAAFEQPHAQGGQRSFDLEAALVHARNLTEFFWAPIRHRRTHQDGVYAAHYVPTPLTWNVIRDSLPQLPNQRYDAISAQLAHLSIRRTTHNGPRDFAVEIPQIAADLSTVWGRWRNELHATAWAAPLDAEVNRWRAAP